MTRLVLLAISGLLLAGCIAPPQPDSDAVSDPSDHDPDAMSANEVVGEPTVAPCTQGGLGLPAGAFCAQKVVKVEGAMRLTRLEVDLATFNGDVAMRAATPGEWSFVATLRASGATADEARKRLDEIEFSWGHTDGSSHYLSALAKPRGNDGSGLSAAFEVSLPRETRLDLVARNVNGAVRVEGLVADTLSAHSVNGKVDVEARATHVDLDTVNGAIDAKLTPAGVGRFEARSVNGQVRLAVPEGAAYGYDVDADSTNGEVTIDLKDGEHAGGRKSEYGPGQERQFRTTDLESRERRAHVALTTVNGKVHVTPL